MKKTLLIILVYLIFNASCIGQEDVELSASDLQGIEALVLVGTDSIVLWKIQNIRTPKEPYKWILNGEKFLINRELAREIKERMDAGKDPYPSIRLTPMNWNRSGFFYWASDDGYIDFSGHSLSQSEYFTFYRVSSTASFIGGLGELVPLYNSEDLYFFVSAMSKRANGRNRMFDSHPRFGKTALVNWSVERVVGQYAKHILDELPSIIETHMKSQSREELEYYLEKIRSLYENRRFSERTPEIKVLASLIKTSKYFYSVSKKEVDAALKRGDIEALRAIIQRNLLFDPTSLFEHYAKAFETAGRWDSEFRGLIRIAEKAFRSSNLEEHIRVVNLFNYYWPENELLLPSTHDLLNQWHQIQVDYFSNKKYLNILNEFIDPNSHPTIPYLKGLNYKASVLLNYLYQMIQWAKLNYQFEDEDMLDEFYSKIYFKLQEERRASIASLRASILNEFRDIRTREEFQRLLAILFLPAWDEADLTYRELIAEWENFESRRVFKPAVEYPNAHEYEGILGEFINGRFFNIQQRFDRSWIQALVLLSIPPYSRLHSEREIVSLRLVYTQESRDGFGNLTNVKRDTQDVEVEARFRKYFEISHGNNIKLSVGILPYERLAKEVGLFFKNEPKGSAKVEAFIENLFHYLSRMNGLDWSPTNPLYQGSEFSKERERKLLGIDFVSGNPSIENYHIFDLEAFLPRLNAN